jgi:sensor histidine kinase regulating citrate/malate metabolism
MADLDAITPKRFCENQTIDLLCSSFDSKAQRLGVSLRVNAQLPKELSLSDTDLCSMVSNGLENALRAASQPDVTDKWVEFYCEIKQNKFLIQIQNPYAGTVTIENGLPVSKQEGHGYGCLSIQTIAQRYGGLFSFQAENGLFTLRLILPLQR